MLLFKCRALYLICNLLIIIKDACKVDLTRKINILFVTNLTKGLKVLYNKVLFDVALGIYVQILDPLSISTKINIQTLYGVILTSYIKGKKSKYNKICFYNTIFHSSVSVM